MRIYLDDTRMNFRLFQASKEKPSIKMKIDAYSVNTKPRPLRLSHDGSRLVLENRPNIVNGFFCDMELPAALELACALMSCVYDMDLPVRVGVKHAYVDEVASTRNDTKMMVLDTDDRFFVRFHPGKGSSYAWNLSPAAAYLTALGIFSSAAYAAKLEGENGD